MNLTYNLEEYTNRPIIRLDTIFRGCTALLDTGALFPLWTKDTSLLVQPGAKLLKKNTAFSGLGGKTYGDIYTITLNLGDILFPNMHIMAAPDDRIPGYFIFSATMFQKMIYTIDNISKKLTITTPDNQLCYHLSILDKNGNVHVLCTDSPNTLHES